MSKKIVVALGGNAILTDDASAQAQMKAVQETAKILIELVKRGHQLVITHGNGPQVGNLLLQQKAVDSPTNPALPLDTLVAMTQGSIGYWLQNAMKEELAKAQIDLDVATVLTQVLIDQADPEFDQPSKPIGPFLTEDEARHQMSISSDIYVEDSGRGYRKVVPSPKAIGIVEERAIKKMVDQNIITITCGGGGIPVVKNEQTPQAAPAFQGMEAVIDKDFASAKLAQVIQADELLILTGVSHVFINFGKENQEKLEEVTVSQLNNWIKEKQFPAGSMLPKIRAAIEFVTQFPQGKAIITSLENIADYFENGSATVITKE